MRTLLLTAAIAVPGQLPPLQPDFPVSWQPLHEQPPLALPGYVHPVQGRVGYGEGMARFGVHRGGHVHAGQDVFAKSGTPLLAIADGRVIETGSGDGRGNYVAIHDPGADRTAVYFHMLHRAAVRRGQRVHAGQRVGRVGCTGSCDGPHLHFELRRGRSLSGRPLNPLPLLRRWTN